jgi:nucleotide-binding universal stress UspA family protein
MELHKILVPIDFSEHSKRALDEALDLAKSFGAELHLLHCYETFPIGAAVAPYDYVVPESVARAVREGAQALLSEWSRKAAGAEVKIHEHVTAGPPTVGIVELAKALGADLIVMGTRGRTGLKHVLLGSVAERTIRIAPCPVLTVKHGVEE